MQYIFTAILSYLQSTNNKNMLHWNLQSGKYLLLVKWHSMSENKRKRFVNGEGQSQFLPVVVNAVIGRDMSLHFKSGAHTATSKTIIGLWYMSSCK